MAATAQAATPIGAFTTKGAFSYVSAPKLHPPRIHTDFTTKTNQLAPGYFMVTNFKNLSSPKPMVGQGGPLILDKNLQPVWFFPVGTDVVAGDLKTQTYNGKPALSWWQGVINKVGITLSGELVVVDQRYHQVATLTGQDGWIISVHDAVIQGHDVWVTAYKTVPGTDLTAAGGLANGTLLDSAVQEYDLTTGKLLFTWDALAPGHIPITESEVHPPPAASLPWDAYHVNSIQLEKGGKFLVSMRNTWAAYLVDMKTGTIDWRLGGKRSTFKIPSNAQFHWQHDVELHSKNRVSIFDDACCLVLSSGKFGPPNGPSRGLVLKLDLAHHKASRTAQYKRGERFDAAFLGNTQLLSNGNVVVGWGSQPFFSEFSGKGQFLFDAFFPTPDLSYRAYVSRWTGKPFYAPSGGVRSNKGKTTVYASWDGSTLVANWAVLAGSSTKHLSVVARARKSGFETAIALPKSYRTYEVEALDSKRHRLGTSGSFSKPSTPSPPGFY
jgi:hypothetical protein